MTTPQNSPTVLSGSGGQPVVVVASPTASGTATATVTAPAPTIMVVQQGGAGQANLPPPPAVGQLDTEGVNNYLKQIDAQITQLRGMKTEASDSGDEAGADALDDQIKQLTTFRASERSRLTVPNSGLIAGGAILIVYGICAPIAAVAVGLSNAFGRDSESTNVAVGVLGLTGLAALPTGIALVVVGSHDRAARSAAGLTLQPMVAVGPTGFTAGFRF